MFLLSDWLGPKWELDIIRTLNNAGNAFFDAIFKGVTFLGDELFFILMAAVLYWCFDKRFAFKFFFAFIGGALTVGIAKTLVARPRPFMQGIESVGSKTHGYSFPSGHSQSIASQSTLLARRFDNKKSNRWVYAIAASVTLLVMFSRMYLAQHFLTDVLVGALIGVGTALLFGYLFDRMKDNEHIYCLFAIPIFVLLMLSQIGGEYDKIKDVFVASGGFSGFAVGYLLEKRYVKYDVKKANWWQQILKFAVGLIVAFAIKEGLKAIFLPENVLCDFIRYFVMAVWAAFAAPALFKYVGNKYNNKFVASNASGEARE